LAEPIFSAAVTRQIKGEIIMGIFGALVGAAIDRTDGDSGIKGAIMGAALQKTASVLAPIAVTFAIGWAVQKAAGMAWSAVSNINSEEPAPVKSRR
jgi:hypothetical protein